MVRQDMTPVQVTVDPLGDVLYARIGEAEIAYSQEAPGDSYLILNQTDAGQVVGIQLLAASEMSVGDWYSHPDRGCVPEMILAGVDEWFRRVPR